jgi:hypothetical protein
MFDGTYTTILNLSTQAWGFIAGLIIIVAVLGGLFQVLQGAAGSAFGASNTTKIAIIGALGLVLIVLIAFLILPQLSEILYQNRPAAPFK